MGNCPSSGLKELLEEVTSNEYKQDAAPLSSGTPDRMTFIDPRSPLVDAERTPIEVLFKSTALTHMSDETVRLTTDETHHHRRQLDDPRSATAGIPRTPILVESPLELNSDNTADAVQDPADVEGGQECTKSAVTDTPVLSRCRTPLAHVRRNAPNASRGSLSSAKVKPQRSVSPLQLLRVRQRLAVKRVLQVGRVEAEVENCPPTGGESAHCEAEIWPIKVSAPPALATKDRALRF